MRGKGWRFELSLIRMTHSWSCFHQRHNRGSCAPRHNMLFDSASWTCAPSTLREILGDVARSSTPSSPILPVSSHLISGGETSTPSCLSLTYSVVDGVRAGAKRLGRKNERALDSPLPPQPRACVYEHQVTQHDLNSSDFFLYCLSGMSSSTYHPPNHTSYPHSRPTSSYSRDIS
jgi:hypothetical protein